MMDIASDVLLVIASAAACAAGLTYLRLANEPARPWSLAVFLAVLGVTTVTSLAALIFPAVEQALRREPGLVRAGEWWRVATALFGSDGGLAGTAASLAALLLVGYVAARLWTWRRWLTQYFGAGLIAAGLAVFWLNEAGAGPAIAVCGLAAGIASSLAMVYIRPVRYLAWASLAAGLLLLALQDPHGLAYGAGLVLASLMTERPSRRPSTA